MIFWSWLTFKQFIHVIFKNPFGGPFLGDFLGDFLSLLNLLTATAGSSGFDVIRGDVCDLDSICAATEGAEAVVHAAAAGMMGTANLPAFDDVTERVNVGGTRNVVEACLKNRVKALGKCMS